MKYEITDETRKIKSKKTGRLITLHRIRATKDFFVYAFYDGIIGAVKIHKGQLGGWIESESNLSQEGRAWVDNGAIAFDKAVVRGDAWLGPGSVIGDSAIITDSVKVISQSKYTADIGDNVKVSGNSRIHASLRGDGHVWNQVILEPREIKRPSLAEKIINGARMLEVDYGHRKLTKFIN